MNTLLPLWNSLYKTDFIVSASNIEAYNLALNPHLWPGKILIIYGSWGKTHLMHTLQRNLGYEFAPTVAQRIIWDNFQNSHINTTAFHQWNQIQEKGYSLCVTLRNAPQTLNIKPHDLKSRMSAALSVRIKPPDYELRRKIFTQWLISNDVSIERQALDYFFTHYDADLPELEQKAQIIRQHALLNQRTATIGCIKESISGKSD